MATKELKAKLSVSDGFSNTLKNFATALTKAERDFQKFEQSMDKSINTLNNSMTKVVNKANEVSKRIGTAYNSMGNQVNTAVNKMNNYISKAEKAMIKLDSQMTGSSTRINNQMNNLNTSYEKLGQNIQKVQQTQNNATKQTVWNLVEVNGELKNVLDGVNNLNKMKNIKVKINKSGKGDGEDDENSPWYSKFIPELKNILKGNFGGVISKLGTVGLGISAVGAEIKFLNNEAQAGFDRLNTITNDFFTVDGLKNAITEAGGFETGKESLQLFYGDTKGQEIYRMASQVALDTYASESSTIDIMSKMGMLGLNVTQDQLTSLIDVAGTRPTVETEHIGLAVKNAVEGRIAMLQMYGINSTVLKNYLETLKTNDPSKYGQLSKAYNGKSVGDRQAYFDLITDYIANGSPFGGYAERYAENTLQGKLERLEGVIQKLTSDIIGMDTMSGERVEGGLYNNFANFIDEFKDMLDTGQLDGMAEGLMRGLGKGSEAIFKGISSALSKIDWDKVGEVFEEIGTSLGKTIENIVDSGVFDRLINMLPDYLDATLNWMTTVAELKAFWETIKASGFAKFFGNLKDKGEAIAHVFNPKNMTAKDVQSLIHIASPVNELSDGIAGFVTNKVGLDKEENVENLRSYFDGSRARKDIQEQIAKVETTNNREYITNSNPVQQFNFNITEAQQLDEDKLMQKSAQYFAQQALLAQKNSSN